MVKVEAICGNCDQVYKSSGTSGFCEKCRKIRELDICEIITSTSIYFFDNLDNLTKTMKDLDLQNNIRLRLDLHDVLDTTEPEELLGDRICCLSYVGKITKTRVEARKEIQERIKTGQIYYGVLVFKRGKDKNSAFTDIGSKAWFNSLLDNSCNPLFVDDSMDHVISVESVGVKSVQKIEHDNLSELIKKH